MSQIALEQKSALLSRALELGACAARVAGPEPPAHHFPRFERWLELGHHADMGYLESGAAARRDLRNFWPPTKSVICIAVPYELTQPPPPPDGLWGYVASCARGTDYHARVRTILEHLADFVRHLEGDDPDFACRISVDTGPILERSLAAGCGLGSIGGNTSILVPGWGSRVVLGELLINRELKPDPPLEESPCRRCFQCVSACPTSALSESGVLDARKCLSHLTVESRGDFPNRLAHLAGQRFFGCDSCLMACPSNAVSPPARPPGRPARPARTDAWPPAWIDLKALADMGSRAVARMTAPTALTRLSRPRLLRNLCVSLGNGPVHPDALEITRRLMSVENAMVRRHASWAHTRLCSTTLLDDTEL